MSDDGFLSRYAWLLAVMVLLAGCSDPTGLGDSSGIFGTFVLETVDGEAVPVRESHPGGGVGATEVLADTITLFDRVWERARHLRSGELDGGETLEWSQPSSGHITRMEDGRFLLAMPCDDVGDCAPNEIFEARGDTLLIDITSDFLFRNLRFVRIPE